MADILIYRKAAELPGPARKQVGRHNFVYNYISNVNKFIAELGSLNPTSTQVIGISADLVTANGDDNTVASLTLAEKIAHLLGKHIVIYGGDSNVIGGNIPNLIYPYSILESETLSNKVKDTDYDPIGSSTAYYKGKFEVTCAFYQNLIDSSSDDSFVRLRAWADSIAPNYLLNTATFESPPAFSEPPTPTLAVGTRTYRFFSPASGTTLEFSLDVLGESGSHLSQVKTYFSDPNQPGVYVGFKPTFEPDGMDPTPYAPYTLDLSIKTAEATLADTTEEAQTNLHFSVSFIEDIKIDVQSSRHDLVKLVSQTPPTLFPNIKGTKILGKVKFKNNPTYYDITDHEGINKATGFTGSRIKFSEKDPLFSWSVLSGSEYLSVDPSGNITVASNQLLGTGPFEATVTFTDPSNNGLAEVIPVNSLDPFSNRLSTSIRVEGLEREKDYTIASYDPLKFQQVVTGAAVRERSYTVYYETTPRTFQEFSDSKWWGKSVISLNLNANYTESRSQVFQITPPIQWYPLLNAGRPPSDFADLLTSKTRPIRETAKSLVGPLNQVKQGVELVQKAVPLLALLDGFRLENLFSALAGPIFDQVLNVLNSGFYWNYLWPLNTESLISRNYLSQAAYQSKLALATGITTDLNSIWTGTTALLNKALDRGQKTETSAAQQAAWTSRARTRSTPTTPTTPTLPTESNIANELSLMFILFYNGGWFFANADFILEKNFTEALTLKDIAPRLHAEFKKQNLLFIKNPQSTEFFIRQYDADFSVEPSDSINQYQFVKRKYGLGGDEYKVIPFSEDVGTPGGPLTLGEALDLYRRISLVYKQLETLYQNHGPASGENLRARLESYMAGGKAGLNSIPMVLKRPQDAVNKFYPTAKGLQLFAELYTKSRALSYSIDTNATAILAAPQTQKQ